MAAWLLTSGDAMCVDACGLARPSCKTHGNGCTDAAMGFVLGEEAGARNLVFFRVEVVAAGDESYLVCAAVAAADRFKSRIVFLLCVLQRVAVPVCVVLCVFWICGCRSQWNGCMIVVIWCCHTCVDPCRFATWCGETHCYGCLKVAWALFCGGVPALRNATSGCSCVRSSMRFS